MSKWTFGSAVAALLLAASAPVHAQERPAHLPARDSAQVADTLPVNVAAGLRLRIDGEWLAGLPLDNASRLRRFLPGYMETAQGTPFHRSPAAFVGTWVDGVPVRTMTHAPAIIPPISGLGGVALTMGVEPASRSDATVIEYTTRHAHGSWTGDARLHTDALSPGAWSDDRTRFDLAAGGPVPGVTGLHVFAAGELWADRHLSLPSGSPPVWMASGTDTTITVAMSNGDNVRVHVPDYVSVDPDHVPLGSTATTGFVGGLAYTRGDGAYSLRYYRNGSRAAGRSLDQLYNPDAWRGADDVSQMINLSVHKPLSLGLTADAVLSHQRYDATRGMLDPVDAPSDADPSLGLILGVPTFIAGERNGRPGDAFLLALRSGLLPMSEMTLTRDDPAAVLRQGIIGVTGSLRLNPYGARTEFPFSGLGLAREAAGEWNSEKRWYGRGSVSRDFGRARIEVGGELDRSEIAGFMLPLADGLPSAFRENISATAAFLETRLSLGNVDVTAGGRLERHGTDALVSRLPGFVTSIPDSLRRDAYVLTPGDEPWESRLQPLADCGGAATAADRTNPTTGAVVCKDNFVAVPDHTEFAPRVRADYDFGRISARAGYGTYIQPPANIGDSNSDIGYVGASAVWARPVDPVRQNVAQLGVRINTTRESWIDVELFHLDITNPVIVKSSQFENPSSGGNVNVQVTQNGEAQRTLGVEITALQQLGRFSGVLATLGLSQFDWELVGKTRTDPLRASAIAWMDFTGIAQSGPAAAVLRDLTISATAAWMQGARYTRFVNEGGGWLAGRVHHPFGGDLAEVPLSSRLPAQKLLDLRIAKGWQIRGVNARLVADVRNPLGIENVHTIYAETGTTENSLYRERRQFGEVIIYSGTGSPQDFVIDDMLHENDLNRHMLRRAEQRFGNGDGVFTVEEMRTTVDSYVALREGTHWFVEGNRELRLGIEVKF